MGENSDHWNDVYNQRAPTEVSWFQPEALASLELIAATHAPLDGPVIDIGAGSSLLVDGLLAKGFCDVTLLDVAESAFVEPRRRLAGDRAGAVHYVVSDVTRWKPERSYAVWHDRAAFHFLTEEHERARYRSVVASALGPDAHAIIATFALDGPDRCSGLPVQRYSADLLAQEFGGILEPVEERSELHTTPKGSKQSFVFVRFRRAP